MAMLIASLDAHILSPKQAHGQRIRVDSATVMPPSAGLPSSSDSVYCPSLGLEAMRYGPLIAF
jgi:hypothetical protein